MRQETSTPLAPTAPLPQLAHDALRLLYQHRLASSQQLHRLLRPNARNPQYVNRNLRRLYDLGLADRLRPGWGQPNDWFLTPHGARAVETHTDTLTRPYRMDAHRASGPLRHHLLAVVDTGLAFVEHARTHGDECGPFDWVPEVSHTVRDAGERLIADALLHYILTAHATGQRAHAQFFLEVDRATMPVSRLAAKLTTYARYYDYVPGTTPARASAARSAQPAWRQLYPRFPRILLILTAASPPRLHQRIQDLAFYLSELRYLQRPRPEFHLGATTLAELQAHGPMASIFLPLLKPQEGPTDFLLTQH